MMDPRSRAGSGTTHSRSTTPRRETPWLLPFMLAFATSLGLGCSKDKGSAAVDGSAPPKPGASSAVSGASKVSKEPLDAIDPPCVTTKALPFVTSPTAADVRPGKIVGCIAKRAFEGRRVVLEADRRGWKMLVEEPIGPHESRDLAFAYNDVAYGAVLWFSQSNIATPHSSFRKTIGADDSGAEAHVMPGYSDVTRRPFAAPQPSTFYIELTAFTAKEFTPALLEQVVGKASGKVYAAFSTDGPPPASAAFSGEFKDADVRYGLVAPPWAKEQR
jgi:hypothetical protein